MTFFSKAAAALVIGLTGAAALHRSLAVQEGTERPYAVSHPLPAPAIFGEGVISTADDEAHPTFTADGRTLYFIKNTPDFAHWTIVVSRHTTQGWSTPEVAPFSGRYSDADVFLTRDDATMYFVSTRPTGPEGPAKDDTDLWRMERDGTSWSEPERVVELASAGNEWFPTMTDTGVLYFGSERREGNHGPEGTSDLWRAKLADGRFGPPENLGEAINTPGNDIEGYIARDESFLIFASNGRPDTHGSYDLYVTYNCRGRWTPPRNLGEPINSSGWEFGARLSPDGRYLFFTSNRGFGGRPLERALSYAELTERLHRPGNGLRDVYQVDVEALKLESPCEASALR